MGNTLGIPEPFEPDPKERYRIQNADFASYLEARGVDKGSAVIMRPEKEVYKQLVIESNILLSFWGSMTASGRSSPLLETHLKS